MRIARASLVMAALLSALLHGQPTAQPGQRGAQPPGSRGGQPPAGGRGGGRGGVQVMTLTTAAWPDGAQIPTKYTQAGDQVSPPLGWTNVPDGIVSFVLLVHDVDAAIGNGTDDILHWMLWNIPAATRSLPEAVPHGSQLPDGTRQVSASGPYYRGPGAAAAGPPHHYVFELFALDAALADVQAVGVSPPQTRAAVLAAMTTHVRGKAVYTGLFKRASQTDTGAEALADIEQQLTRAVLSADRAAYSAFLADDWSVINTDGNILAKEQVLREMFVTGDRKIETIAVDDVKVRPLGDTAVVTGRTVATGSLRGTRATVRLRFTDVFARRDGRWQIVASQGTLIP